MENPQGSLSQQIPNPFALFRCVHHLAGVASEIGEATLKSHRVGRARAWDLKH